MALKKGWYWPWLLVIGMSGIVGVNTVMLFVAGSDRNGSVVEPDYYRKAVAWDSTMALARASAALGWRAEVALVAHAEATGGDSAVLRLVDRDGAAVRGATVRAVMIHNADAATHVDVPLRETAAGTYVGAAALAHTGLWEVRVDAVREREYFVATMHSELRPAGR